MGNAAIRTEGLRKRGWAEGTWPARHTLPPAIAWPLLITAIFLPLSVRRYRGLSW
jgi:hypothetical protein